MVYLHIHVTKDEDVSKVKQTTTELIDKKCAELKQLCYKRFLQNVKPILGQQTIDNSTHSWHPDKSPRQNDDGNSDDDEQDVPPVEEEEVKHDVRQAEEGLSQESTLFESDCCFDDPPASSITPETAQDKDSSLQNVMDGLSDKEMMFDISRLARLSGLVFSVESNEPRYNAVLNLVEGEHLSACRVDWWERPYWAWTWKDILLAEAALFCTEIAMLFQDAHMTVATDPLLSRLPYLLASHTSCSMTIINPENDRSYIQQALESISKVDDRHIRSLKDKYRERREICPSDEIRQFVHAIQNVVWPKTDYSVATIDTEELLKTDEEGTQFSKRRANEISEAGESKSTISPSDSREIRVANPYTKSKNCMVAPHETKTENELDTTESDSSHGHHPESKLVTPEISRQSSQNIESRSCSVHVDEQQDLPRSPQIDSQGIDLTVLSQLPLAFRSEARLAHFIGTESNDFLRRKRGPLHRWMVDATSIVQIPRISLSPERRLTQRKRRKVGIEGFFRSRTNGC